MERGKLSAEWMRSRSLVFFCSCRQQDPRMCSLPGPRDSGSSAHGVITLRSISRAPLLAFLISRSCPRSLHATTLLHLRWQRAPRAGWILYYFFTVRLVLVGLASVGVGWVNPPPDDASLGLASRVSKKSQWKSRQRKALTKAKAMQERESWLKFFFLSKIARLISCITNLTSFSCKIQNNTLFVYQMIGTVCRQHVDESGPGAQTRPTNRLNLLNSIFDTI